MILVNTDYIGGKELEMLGLVKGSTIQSKNIGRDITQSLKTLVGGELKAYNDMMNEARALATKRMVAEAEALGADAVVNRSSFIRNTSEDSSGVIGSAWDSPGSGTITNCILLGNKAGSYLIGFAAEEGKSAPDSFAEGLR